jgi:hypothetical protein
MSLLTQPLINDLIDQKDPFIVQQLYKQNKNKSNNNNNCNGELCADLLRHSNVYSFAENVLLVWISAHYNQKKMKKTHKQAPNNNKGKKSTSTRSGSK